MHKKLLMAGFVLLLSAFMIDGCASTALGRTQTYHFDSSSEVLYNPLIGYAPSARTTTFQDESTLVYVELTWAEVEPEEGEYAFDEIEEHYNLQKWRDMGKHVVLRFVCDSPSDEAHRDIPDWLYEKTGDGVDYDLSYGMGYCPDYSNPIFIEEHTKVIAALGKYFDQDHLVKYIELGSLGHWGEWHISTEDDSLPNMPRTEIRKKYVDAYTSAFSDAKFLMRRPFAELPDGGGVYNDMIGDSEETQRWLDWIANGGEYDQTGEVAGLTAVPNVWETAPVGGEFNSTIEMSAMMDINYSQTASLIKDSHMSFIGPMVPSVDDLSTVGAANAYKLLNSIGYRYTVTQMDFAEKDSTTSSITLYVTNKGVAPIYWKYPLCIYIKDAGGQMHRYETSMDMTSIAGGESATASVDVSLDYDNLLRSTVSVGMEDPDTGKPSVYLATDAERDGTCSILFTPGTK